MQLNQYSIKRIQSSADSAYKIADDTNANKIKSDLAKLLMHWKNTLILIKSINKQLAWRNLQTTSKIVSKMLVKVLGNNTQVQDIN